MTEETLRSKTNLAIWLAVAITLVPLVPYALRGPGAPAPAQLGMQSDAPSSMAVTASAVERNS